MCALLYKDVTVHVSGPGGSGITGDYEHDGFTIWYGRQYDLWKSDELGYFIWRAEDQKGYVIADTFPSSPGPTDAYWQTWRTHPCTPYYPRGTASGNAHIYAVKEAKTDWHLTGMATPRLVRSGDFKLMKGQAFYPRCTWPPRYSGANFSCTVRLGYVATPPDEQRCCWQPNTNTITYYEYHLDPDIVHPYSGISIFQVKPKSAGRPYEREHTHIVGWANPWPARLYDNYIYFVPYWQPPQGFQIRYFARAWHHTHFRHVGPAWTIPCTPPVECPCNAQEWAALYAQGVPCHGLIQKYQIADWYDGKVKGCPVCNTNTGRPYDGTFIASATPCLWTLPTAEPPYTSIDGRQLYGTYLQLVDQIWKLSLLCYAPSPHFGTYMWRGEKTIGQTPTGRYVLTDSYCPTNQLTYLNVQEPPPP